MQLHVKDKNNLLNAQVNYHKKTLKQIFNCGAQLWKIISSPKFSNTRVEIFLFFLILSRVLVGPGLEFPNIEKTSRSAVSARLVFLLSKFESIKIYWLSVKFYWLFQWKLTDLTVRNIFPLMNQWKGQSLIQLVQISLIQS